LLDARTEGRRTAVLLALAEDKDLAADCPAPAFVAHEADALAEQIEARVNEPLVLNGIERKKRIVAYELCI
jgi:hypothetical protein